MNKKVKIIIICAAALGLFLIFINALINLRETTAPGVPMQTPEGSVGERTSVQPRPSGESKAIRQPADVRGESANVSLKTVLEINNVRYESEITAETSVYDLMTLLKDDGEITFTETTYIGMGKLITGINGMKSGGERTWIYYVNGSEAQVGVSNYKIMPGDVVSWKYEEVRY